MSLIDNRIIEFIHKHHVLTLATSCNNEPYCANCFYVYLEDENCLVFTSDKETRHVNDMLSNKCIAGSIVLETNLIGKIQGIQFRGTVQQANGELLKKANKAYLKRFPMAMLMKTMLWTIDLTFIKMTDNRLGFGKKLIWKNSFNEE
jgi:uncharacterized protein